MSTDILPFDYGGETVRVIEINNEPHFVLGDLCQVLGIANSRNVAERIEEDGVRKIDVTDSIGRSQQTTVVTESGLYEVVIRSNSEAARPFRRWVTHEVLPQLRKTGSYEVAPLDEIEVAERYLSALKEKKALAAQVKELEGPAAQAKVLREAEGLRTIQDLLGDLKMHGKANYPGVKIVQDDVFDLAGRVGLIIRGNTVRHNQPTNRAIDAGWVRPKETLIDTNHGQIVKYSARLTSRGYGRLWDAAVTNLKEHGCVLPSQKELA